MKFRVIVSKEAKQDLRDIWEHIAVECAEPEAASVQVQRIILRNRSLSNFPLRYPLCHELLWYDKRLRSVPVDKYHVFYRPDEERGIVEVVRIIHGSRDIQAIFLDGFLKD